MSFGALEDVRRRLHPEPPQLRREALTAVQIGQLAVARPNFGILRTAAQRGRAEYQRLKRRRVLYHNLNRQQRAERQRYDVTHIPIQRQFAEPAGERRKIVVRPQRQRRSMAR